MSTSLSALVDNLSEGIYNKKCTNCSSDLKYISRRKSGKSVFKCLKCKRKYFEKLDEEDLTKRFKNTYKFCNGDFNKIMLLLRKVIYPY